MRVSNLIIGIILLTVLGVTFLIYSYSVESYQAGLKVDDYQVQLDDCNGEMMVLKAENNTVKAQLQDRKDRADKEFNRANQAEAELAKLKKSLQSREAYQFANGAFHTCVFVTYQLTHANMTEVCVGFTKALLEQEAWKLEPSPQFYENFGGLNSSSVKPTEKGTQISY